MITSDQLNEVFKIIIVIIIIIIICYPWLSVIN
jgi:uncharacterized membrane protein (DUF106 family)